MELSDRDGRAFREGVYVDYRASSVEPERAGFYKVFRENDVWKAKCADGKEYELSYPRGLPDSSRMPDGMVDASDLRFVPKKELSEYVSRLSHHLTEVSEVLKFLEQVATEKSGIGPIVEKKIRRQARVRAIRLSGSFGGFESP